jgi:hypothetical protein
MAPPKGDSWVVKKGARRAAAVFFGRLSEYLGEAAAIRKLTHDENAC